MKFNESKGLKTNRWLQNELAMSDDFNFLGMNGYKNFSDLMAAIAEQGVEDGSGPNIIISGLLLEWSTVLTSYLRTGIAVSFKGYYLDEDGNWGFNSSSGDVFAIKVGSDQAVAVDAGSALDRYDTIEIRPVQTGYDTESRKFKDPFTGLVTSSNMETKIEYGVQIQILKGTGGAGVAPTHTSGWIKVAEVFVLASASVIAQSDIKDVRDSDTWTTEASNTVYKKIKDFGIDFGTGADQVAAEDIPHSIADIFTTEGDIGIRGASIPERLAAGVLDSYLKGQGAGNKPIYEKLALRDTGVSIGFGARSSSGNDVITGIGFRPSVVIFGGSLSDGTKNSMCVGFDNLSSYVCIYYRVDLAQWLRNTVYSIAVMKDNSNQIYGKVSATGSDGFTITWGIQGTCAIEYIYLALP